MVQVWFMTESGAQWCVACQNKTKSRRRLPTPGADLWFKESLKLFPCKARSLLQPDQLMCLPVLVLLTRLLECTRSPIAT